MRRRLLGVLEREGMMVDVFVHTYSLAEVGACVGCVERAGFVLCDLVRPCTKKKKKKVVYMPAVASRSARRLLRRNVVLHTQTVEKQSRSCLSER